MSTPVIELLLRQKGAEQVAAEIRGVGAAYGDMDGQMRQAGVSTDVMVQRLNDLKAQHIGAQKSAVGMTGAIETSNREIRLAGRELAMAAGGGSIFGRELGSIAANATQATSALGAMNLVAGGLTFAAGIGASMVLLENIREIGKELENVQEEANKLGSAGAEGTENQQTLDRESGLGQIGAKVAKYGKKAWRGLSLFGNTWTPGADTGEEQADDHANTYSVVKDGERAAARDKALAEMAKRNKRENKTPQQEAQEYFKAHGGANQAAFDAKVAEIEGQRKKEEEAKRAAVQAQSDMEKELAEGARDAEEEQKRETAATLKNMKDREAADKAAAEARKKAVDDLRKATDDLAAAQKAQADEIANKGLAAAVAKDEAATRDAGDRLRQAEDNLRKVREEGAKIGVGEHFTAADAMAQAGGNRAKAKQLEAEEKLRTKIQEEARGKRVRFTPAEQKMLSEEAAREIAAAAAVGNARGGLEQAQRGAAVAKEQQQAAQEKAHAKATADAVIKSAGLLQTMNDNLARLKLPGWQQAAGERAGGQ